MEETHSKIKELTSSRPRPLVTKQIIPRRFQVHKVLGQGSFGKVLLASPSDAFSTQPGELVALKLVKKCALKEPKHIQHLFDEKDVLRRVPSHPHVLKLRETLSDKSNLYLSMEYFPGGDMAHLMRSFLRPFREDEAKFYAAEIASGLAHLHKNGIVYRDLKPDNIVVRANGHVALCDFGFAKYVGSKDGIARTFCGSVEFMAPELVLGKGYTSAVDWWSFGAMIFDFLVYAPPFDFDPDLICRANSRTNLMPDEDLPNQEKFKRILRGLYAFPYYGTYSTPVRNLVAGLLQLDPARRFQGEKVCSHRWLAEARTNGPAPWVPKPSSPPQSTHRVYEIDSRGPHYNYADNDVFAGF